MMLPTTLLMTLANDAADNTVDDTADDTVDDAANDAADDAADDASALGDKPFGALNDAPDGGTLDDASNERRCLSRERGKGATRTLYRRTFS